MRQLEQDVGPVLQRLVRGWVLPVQLPCVQLRLGSVHVVQRKQHLGAVLQPDVRRQQLLLLHSRRVHVLP